MGHDKSRVSPEQVLSAIYGKTSLETGMSEKRRDEVIAAAIFVSFRNQEFGTRFRLPAGFRDGDIHEDASGIDMVVSDERGRKKKLQIKGVHIQRSIERRKAHSTRGVARVTGSKSQKLIRRDSDELARIMRGELSKIDQDYNGIYLIIHISADLATQTSLELAMRRNQDLVARMRAKEVWFLRGVPVRALRGKQSQPNCHAYELIKAAPDKRTYCFAFSLYAFSCQAD